MKRTLLAFGDSHTAGSEIEYQWQSHCYEKAYPAYIAKHYEFDYLNFAQPGGGNYWMFKKVYEIVPQFVSKNIPIFVVCNFCEPSRMFFIDENDGNIYHSILSDLFKKQDPSLIKFLPPKKIRDRYRQYLKDNPDKLLTLKSILIIKKIQNICKENNIPFLFHISSFWYDGNWKNIDKKNFYGHHDSDIIEYTSDIIQKYQTNYSYWGRCIKYKFNKKFQPQYRWKYHFPEVYHVYWANLLIQFIEQQKILEGYI